MNRQNDVNFVRLFSKYDKFQLSLAHPYLPRVDESARDLLFYPEVKFKPNTGLRQESIPVGCVLPACQPYLFWWTPLGVSTGGGRGTYTYHSWDTNPLQVGTLNQRYLPPKKEPGTRDTSLPTKGLETRDT